VLVPCRYKDCVAAPAQAIDRDGDCAPIISNEHTQIRTISEHGGGGGGGDGGVKKPKSCRKGWLFPRFHNYQPKVPHNTVRIMLPTRQKDDPTVSSEAMMGEMDDIKLLIAAYEPTTLPQLLNSQFPRAKVRSDCCCNAVTISHIGLYTRTYTSRAMAMVRHE